MIITDRYFSPGGRGLPGGDRLTVTSPQVGVDFQEVIDVINACYEWRPVEYYTARGTEDELTNTQGMNEGAGRVLAFAKINGA